MMASGCLGRHTGGLGGGEMTPSKLETQESSVTMRGSDAQLRWGHDEFEAH